MATATREIPPEQWGLWFDGFSQDAAGMYATLEVIGMEVGAQVEADRPRLTGISYDDKDDILVIGLDSPGGPPEDVEHIVYNPRRIMFAEGEGLMVFDIEDSEGAQTLLRLEPSE